MRSYAMKSSALKKTDDAPIRPIKNERNHAQALRQIEALWGAKKGSPEADRLEVLATLVAAYEDKHHRIPPPDPVQAILFRMEQMGLTRSDLVKIIGSRSRVSEVLGYKRPLSVQMIARLRETLGISADVLIAQHQRRSS